MDKRGSLPRKALASAEDRLDVISNRPSSPNSTPRPDRLTPPKGALGWIAPCLLIQTDPHSSRRAISLARAMSLDQTDPPSPLSLALAAAMASSTSAVADDRQRGAELFFDDQRCIIRQIGDQRDREEQPFIRRTAQQDAAIARGGGHQTADLVVLHLVVDRTKGDPSSIPLPIGTLRA
jgi:hypothetical protein